MQFSGRQAFGSRRRLNKLEAGPQKLSLKVFEGWILRIAFYKKMGNVKKLLGLYAYGMFQKLFHMEREICVQNALNFYL